MRRAIKTIAFITVCAALAIPACKKGKDTETAADTEPKRPPTPSGTMSLRGTYTQAGAYGTFRDCTTGSEWPAT